MGIHTLAQCRAARHISEAQGTLEESVVPKTFDGVKFVFLPISSKASQLFGRPLLASLKRLGRLGLPEE